jgi:hypothetical protein
VFGVGAVLALVDAAAESLVADGAISLAQEDHVVIELGFGATADDHASPHLRLDQSGESLNALSKGCRTHPDTLIAEIERFLDATAKSQGSLRT